MDKFLLGHNYQRESLETRDAYENRRLANLNVMTLPPSTVNSAKRLLEDNKNNENLYFLCRGRSTELKTKPLIQEELRNYLDFMKNKMRLVTLSSSPIWT
jgi:hypothetical protein